MYCLLGYPVLLPMYAVPMSALLGGLIVIMNRIISDEAQSDWTFCML